MDPVLLYATCLGAAVCLLIAFRVGYALKDHFHLIYVSFCRNWLAYPLVYTRRRGTTNVSVLELLLIIGYALVNAVVLAVRVSNLDELSIRSSLVFVINLILLCGSGRTNIFSDILRIDGSRFELAHRWIGRTAILEGCLHAALEQISKKQTAPLGLPLSCVTIGVLVFSFLPARRLAFEIFVKAHWLMALAVLLLLWWHVGVSWRLQSIALVTASGLWVLQRTVWTALLLRRNWGLGRDVAVVKSIPESPDRGVQAVQLRLKVKRSWHIVPGQYVYVTLPNCGSLNLPVLQAHPYYIVWVASSPDDVSQQLVLLVETKRGFSKEIRFGAQVSQRAILDGPYGVVQNLAAFDKVLLFASGVGVSAHIMHIKHLLDVHNQNIAKVRRISLVWMVEAKEQIGWVKEFLYELINDDYRSVLTIVIYVPFEKETVKLDEQHARVFEAKLPLAIDWTISKEWSTEAGSMAVKVCGHPFFERCIRRAVSRAKHSITLFGSTFQPDETYASKTCWDRFVPGPADQRTRLQKANV